MQKVRSACSLVIVKAPKHLGSCVWRQKDHQELKYVFKDNSKNVVNDLEMCPSRRIVDVVDKSSKSPSLSKDKNIKDIEEAKEQVGNRFSNCKSSRIST